MGFGPRHDGATILRSMKRRPGLPLLAAGVTLGVHVLVAVFFEMPGSFAKYTLAAEQYLSGELPSDYDEDIKPAWATPLRLDRDPAYDKGWLRYEEVDIYGHSRK